MVKVKSWTGDEVEARVGMVVSFYNQYKTNLIGNIGEIYDTEADVFIPEDDDYHTVSLAELTMLHCPFQVDDPIEVKNYSGEWLSGYKFKSNFVPEYCRHTNPSLRTSEEYENEHKN